MAGNNDGLKYRWQVRNFDHGRHGKLLWRKIAGTQGRSGIPAAFLNFPKADFAEATGMSLPP
ncbi:MAG: hypothetical protein ACI4P6_00745 [Candidatus Spyradosoma sp.]